VVPKDTHHQPRVDIAQFVTDFANGALPLEHHVGALRRVLRLLVAFEGRREVHLFDASAQAAAMCTFYRIDKLTSDLVGAT